jgi:hypothetical protein
MYRKKIGSVAAVLGGRVSDPKIRVNYKIITRRNTKTKKKSEKKQKNKLHKCMKNRRIKNDK